MLSPYYHTILKQIYVRHDSNAEHCSQASELEVDEVKVEADIQCSKQSAERILLLVTLLASGSARVAGR